MKWLGLGVLLLIWPGSSSAQVRSEGMAGAGSAMLDGLDAACVNPARLAVSGRPCIRLVGTWAEIANNSFSLADYRAYNGADLTERDKEKLLAHIEEGEGLEGHGAVSAEGPGLCVRGWAIGVRGRGSAVGVVPKDLFVLILNGNTLGRTFRFDDADGSGDLLGELYVGHGRTIKLPWGFPVAVGASVKYLRGWLHEEVREASGTIRTDPDHIQGEGTVRARHSTGGNGLGIDLGVYGDIARSWSAALSLRDLFGHVNWKDGNKRTTARVRLRESTLRGLKNGEELVETKHETEQIGAFRTSIPPVMTAGVSRAVGRFCLVADCTQGFGESSLTTRTPRLSVGTEARLLPAFRGRAGISFGGRDGRSLALGMGLTPGPIRMDLSISARGGLVPLMGRGIGAGFSLSMLFK